MGDSVLFVEMNRRVTICCKVKRKKRSRSESESE